MTVGVLKSCTVRGYYYNYTCIVVISLSFYSVLEIKIIRVMSQSTLDFIYIQMIHSVDLIVAFP